MAPRGGSGEKSPTMTVPPALFADPRLRRVLHLLNGGGEETRVVGGAVRNALLGLPPGDLDLATTMPPDAVMARAAAAKIRTAPTGIAHGTVTLVSGGLPIEVTTLREDVETDGRHAVVRFGRDFVRDAERRDFTMNALSAGLDGVLHDAVGGTADLEARRVRFIGDPATRIREDYLRILRFFRFHATYGRGALDAAGLAASSGGRDGIDRLSRERVRAETMKLLGAPGAVAAVEAMETAGLLEKVLHGPADLARFRRLSAQDADPLLRLAALTVRDPADVDRLRDSLRLSNGERDRLLAMLRARPSDEGAPDERASLNLLYDHGRSAAVDAVKLARANAGDGMIGWVGVLAFVETAAIPTFPFTGGDLLARGLMGPEIGIALALLRRAFAEAGFPDDPTEQTALLDALAET